MVQVISRAWRLGTKAREINAIQLYMKDTVEQFMFDADEAKPDSGKEEDFDNIVAAKSEKPTTVNKSQAKVKYLFERLALLKQI